MLRLATMLCLLAAALSVISDSGAETAPGDGQALSACPAIRIATGDFAPDERALICDAAGETRAFFRAHGITIKRSIHLTMGKSLADPARPHIGSYSLTNETVSLLGLAETRHRLPSSTLFGLPMNETLYHSVVVHELAHAIANQHFHVNRPSLVAQEYIAYVAQLSTMEQATRDRILAASRLPAYESVDEMSSTYYAMDPSGFGIKVYRHFISLDDPGAFLRGLLSGEIRPENTDHLLP